MKKSIIVSLVSLFVLMTLNVNAKMATASNKINQQESTTAFSRTSFSKKMKRSIKKLARYKPFKEAAVKQGRLAIILIVSGFLLELIATFSFNPALFILGSIMLLVGAVLAIIHFAKGGTILDMW